MGIRDLSGQRFGSIVVIEKDIEKRINDKVYWKCKCDCGELKSIVGMSLVKDGGTRSCGKCQRVKKIPIIGKKYKKLLVLSRDGINTWKCECDCGKILSIKGYELIRGRVSCSTSCGIKLEKGVASFNSAYSEMRKSARQRQYVWNISKRDFRLLTSKNCYYCGSLPKGFINRPDLNGVYYYNSLDRVDNSIGYELNNVVPCCWVCNRAKAGLGIKKFKSHIIKVHNHWASK